MRRDKIVARILLIFSVANVAVAAPALVRQRHLDVPEGVRATSEKRVDLDDEPLDDWPPISPPMSYHEGLPSQQFPWWHWNSMPHMWWLDGQDSEVNHDSVPSSPTAGSLSPSGSVKPDLVSDSEEPANSPQPVLDSSHYHSVPEPANPPTLDGSAPESAVPSAHGDPAPESGAPSFHDVSAPVAAAPSAHGDPAPEATTPPVHDVSAPEPGAPSLHDASASVAAAPSTHDVSAPVAAAPSTHGDPAPQPGDLLSHQDSAPGSSATASQAVGFFSDELKRKIKLYSVLGVATAGAIFGLKKLKDIVFSEAYVSPLLPPSPADVKPSHEHSDL